MPDDSRSYHRAENIKATDRAARKRWPYSLWPLWNETLRYMVP